MGDSSSASYIHLVLIIYQLERFLFDLSVRFHYSYFQRILIYILLLMVVLIMIGICLLCVGAAPDREVSDFPHD